MGILVWESLCGSPILVWESLCGSSCVGLCRLNAGICVLRSACDAGRGMKALAKEFDAGYRISRPPGTSPHRPRRHLWEHGIQSILYSRYQPSGLRGVCPSRGIKHDACRDIEAMLLCLALQIADAKQMQIAACRMQMQNALQMQIALQNCRSEKQQLAISNGLRATGVVPDLSGAARQWPAQRSFARPLLCNAAGCLSTDLRAAVWWPPGHGLGVQMGSHMESRWVPDGSPEASWGLLGS